MTRLRAILLVGVVVALAATSAAGGQRTQPVLRRPNPLFVSLGLDYVNPIPAVGGGYAQFAPLKKSVIKASVTDLEYLAYAKEDDLGGFIPAPIGWLATGNCYPPKAGVVCPGHIVVGTNGGATQIPLYAKQAHAKVNSYTWTAGHAGRVRSHCVACGAITFPGGLPTTTPVFPANNGFGGQPTPPPKKPRHPKPPFHAGSPGDCGAKGISIVSNLPHCRIYVINQAPGDGTFEKMTITNTTNVPYVLSFRATGTPNRLWDDLQMGVWVQGTPAPTPLPPLHFWTQQYNQLVTLAPGQAVHYRIELYLPLIAGNADQNLTAVIDFRWRAVQKTSG